MQVAAPNSRADLPRSNSVKSGFFFCGIAEEPVENASGSSTKPNSAVEKIVNSSAKREMCKPRIATAWQNSSAKSRSEVASIEFCVGASKFKEEHTSELQSLRH